MHIKSIVAGAAIALASTVGAASAADQFPTLVGIMAQPMNAAEMDQVRGTVITLNIPSGPLVDGDVEIALNDILAVNTVSAPTRTVPQ